jgi:hypothetical protein
MVTSGGLSDKTIFPRGNWWTLPHAFSCSIGSDDGSPPESDAIAAVR